MARASESIGSRSSFLLKRDPTGAPLWSKRFGTPLREAGDALAIDGNGIVLIVGNYAADRYNYFNNARDLGFGGCAITANRSFDGSAMFMAKLDPDGSHIWSRGVGFDPHYGPRVAQMTLDALDNAYIVIQIEERTEVVKVDAMGNVLWTRRTPGYPDYGIDLALDSAGNVVTVDNENFFHSVVFPEAYVNKFSPDGDSLWSRKVDDSGSVGSVAVSSVGEILVLINSILIKLDQDGEEVFTQPVHRSGSIAVDPADNIFLGGGGLTMLDPSGTELWTLDFAASVGDIVFSPNGAVAVTGVVSGPVDFGTGPIAYTEGRDIYVAAFNPPASGDSGEGGGGGCGGGGGGGGGGSRPFPPSMTTRSTTPISRSTAPATR